MTCLSLFLEFFLQHPLATDQITIPYTKQFILAQAFLSWELIHMFFHQSHLGDPGWSVVWLQLFSGCGEGAACQRQPSGAKEVPGWIWTVQVRKTPESQTIIMRSQ